MSALAQLTSSFWFDLKRYIRSPGLLLVALAVPIAAHYMVPGDNASYAVLTLNEMKPIRSASVLGLELGVLAATLLTPLAYIFLRAGPTRHRPWQISDVAPHSRIMAALGRWAADTAALWMLLAGLTAAGLIIGLFRLEGSMNIFKVVTALWLPAAPALAIVAAIRLFMDARNFTRRWLGDVIFFFAWVFLLVIGLIAARNSVTGHMTAKPFGDAFGFSTPLINSIDAPVTSITIGGATNTSRSLDINAWQSLTDGVYLQARILWLVAAAGIAMLAGLIWEPMKTRKPKLKQGEAPAIAHTSIADITFKAPITIPSGTANYLSVIISEIKLILKNKTWLICLVAAGLMGALAPFRTVAGPAILLALIFPLTDASSRWQAKSTGALLNTLGTDKLQRTALLYIAAAIIAAVIILPAAARLMITGNIQWLPHIGLIIFAVPAFIVAAGTITRSAVTGRLIMLIIWYIYLSSVSF